MSGELKIVLSDGSSYWFGRDDHFPDKVRIHGSDPHHWHYLPTDEAKRIVQQALEHHGEVEQGDATRFFLPVEGEETG
ncbi:MAG TPA: hypothetical protein VHA53_02790 [Nitrolancea sp.]|nr:hypothetical protein [Nitrolancea sp.]